MNKGQTSFSFQFEGNMNHFEPTVLLLMDRNSLECLKAVFVLGGENEGPDDIGIDVYTWSNHILLLHD